MKVTFPHMGTLYIIGKALLESLGLEVIIPPPITKRTLSLGIQYSPEFACLPLKINMGNFIEAAELGADTILMSGGVGPCRFGYYSEVQREILQDLGYRYQFIVFEPPDTHFSELTQKVKYLSINKPIWQVAKAFRLAWTKTRALDIVEEKVQQIRAREQCQGTTNTIHQWALSKIDEAKDHKQVLKIQNHILQELDHVSIYQDKPVLKVGIVGEIYTVLEPFVNLDIEKHLGRLGVEVSRSIYLSQWINDHLLKGWARVRSNKDALKLASPYLRHFVGGHGQDTVGNTVKYAHEGYHGVVQLAPLTCMPEIVAQTILPVVCDKESIPTMTIYLDEQTGEAGMLTRLEAFIDLLYRKRNLGIKESLL